MYATPSAIKPGSYFEPVISELKKKIRLRCLTYKVTTYVHLTPYLNSFQQFYTFLTSFKRDISDQT